MVKNTPANAGDMGLLSGLGRSPGNPVFLSVKSYEQEPGKLQSVGSQESDTT